MAAASDCTASLLARSPLMMRIKASARRASIVRVRALSSHAQLTRRSQTRSIHFEKEISSLFRPTAQLAMTLVRITFPCWQT